MLAAHGTASLAGHQTLISLVRNVHALRPGLRVELGFVDVLLPRLEDVLDELNGTMIIVPALLSSGYHVSSDIPRAVRRRRTASITRHLGPDPLLARALADRLAAGRDASRTGPTGPVVLVSTGSSDPAASADLDAAAADLAARIGVEVRGLSLAALDSIDLAGVEVASYLLAEGRMFDTIVERAGAAAFVTLPIGSHPVVAELVLQRYDEALSG